MRRVLAVLTVTAVAAGVVSFGQGAWIFVKAGMAQVLLEQAWDRASDGDSRPVPWPWADTWPVARLAAPRLDEEVIVLAGATGAVLAFGPGHLAGTAAPGETGNTVVAGHRGTHFAFLRHLEPGDELVLATPGGSSRSYRVEARRVVDESDAEVLAPSADDVLTLVTCYPFDAVVSGPQRYVVRARSELRSPDPRPAADLLRDDVVVEIAQDVAHRNEAQELVPVRDRQVPQTLDDHPVDGEDRRITRLEEVGLGRHHLAHRDGVGIEPGADDAETPVFGR